MLLEHLNPALLKLAVRRRKAPKAPSPPKFVQDIAKQISRNVSARMRQKPAYRGSFGKRMKMMAGTHAPKALLLGGAGAGVAAAIIGVHKIRKRHAYQSNFNNMMKAHPSLRREDKATVKSRFNTVFNLAPTLTSDPYTAGSLVKQLVEYPTISPTTLKELARAEADLRPSRPIGAELIAASHALAGG